MLVHSEGDDNRPTRDVIASEAKQSHFTAHAAVAEIASSGTDLGFTRDRQSMMRKSGKPDLRGLLAMTVGDRRGAPLRHCERSERPAPQSMFPAPKRPGASAARQAAAPLVHRLRGEDRPSARDRRSARPGERDRGRHEAVRRRSGPADRATGRVRGRMLPCLGSLDAHRAGSGRANDTLHESPSHTGAGGASVRGVSPRLQRSGRETLPESLFEISRTARAPRARVRLLL